MHFPTWVDLKGLDAVPETVHHVVCLVDPLADTCWHNLKRKVKVRGGHSDTLLHPPDLGLCGVFRSFLAFAYSSRLMEFTHKTAPSLVADHLVSSGASDFQCYSLQLMLLLLSKNS